MNLTLDFPKRLAFLTHSAASWPVTSGASSAPLVFPIKVRNWRLASWAQAPPALRYKGTSQQKSTKLAKGKIVPAASALRYKGTSQHEGTVLASENSAARAQEKVFLLSVGFVDNDTGLKRMRLWWLT